MKKLVIIGAGDFGRELAHLVERINSSNVKKEWDLIGFIDDNKSLIGKTIDGYPVLNGVSWLNSIEEEIFAACSIGVGTVRKKVIDRIVNKRIKFATLIDPNAVIFKNCTIGEGSIICAGTVISINVNIKEHVIINLNSTLGHDDIVESFCTINPGVNISGKVNIGRCSDLGTGTKIIQGINVGENSTIGAGGVVIRDVPSNCLAVGCPTEIKQYK